MVRRLFFLLFALSAGMMGYADKLDSLETLMREKTVKQEKIYIHTDNNCYFVGDTIWYKAYVVNADDLKPTTYSNVLYVELLTPDGYLVERQQLYIRDDGSTTCQFALSDSLYSGYYEVRAYTKWHRRLSLELGGGLWCDIKETVRVKAGYKWGLTNNSKIDGVTEKNNCLYLSVGYLF